MYLQPQTVHKHTLTEITELAAIFGGMLTVATFLQSTRIGSTVSGWIVIHICGCTHFAILPRTAVPSDLLLERHTNELIYLFTYLQLGANSKSSKNAVQQTFENLTALKNAQSALWDLSRAPPTVTERISNKWTIKQPILIFLVLYEAIIQQISLTNSTSAADTR